ncbi:hypothetical protein LTR62_001521 [Meristemomyces frigidus]|uniref:DNA replication factor Cdt1 C-terminal domain-containing protein n=1 Tax=Meristemomyces frigidus TaxID=1508187 RepID=A0AAN7THB3_9PEZI|nr:hypothetical protein LTR62_001521 [Meristemomyces frigidus]
MAISRKRKHDDNEGQQTGKHISATQSIKDFATVTKEVQPVTRAKKIKTTHVDLISTASANITAIEPPKSVKRKRSQESSSDLPADPPSTKANTADIFRQFAKINSADLPRSKRVKTVLPPSPAGTPSKKAAALFDKLKIEPVPFMLNDKPAGIDTPPDTPGTHEDVGSIAWPTELQDLWELYAAFLTALSLYYAHNGTSGAANVKNLLEMTSKHWKKRAVNLVDLRRLLAVGSRDQADFILEDYGRAGVCMSRAQPRGRGLKRTASYVDEDDLNVRFQEALQAEWQRWERASEEENNGASTFIDQLPMAEIVVNASVKNASPLFARGQQRLADIKAAQAGAIPSSDNQAAAVKDEQKTTKAVQSRGSSLLDRVLARQASTASMPAGPTKAQLERKAALDRIEDIARALGSLVGMKARACMSMQAMVQQLQQSLRNPISREEVERCLDLMANEVTPGFVSVIVSGSVKGVVVSRMAKPDIAVVRESVVLATSV